MPPRCSNPHPRCALPASMLAQPRVECLLLHSPPLCRWRRSWCLPLTSAAPRGWSACSASNSPPAQCAACALLHRFPASSTVWSMPRCNVDTGRGASQTISAAGRKHRAPVLSSGMQAQDGSSNARRERLQAPGAAGADPLHACSPMVASSCLATSGLSHLHAAAANKGANKRSTGLATGWSRPPGVHSLVQLQIDEQQGAGPAGPRLQPGPALEHVHGPLLLAIHRGDEEHDDRGGGLGVAGGLHALHQRRVDQHAACGRARGVLAVSVVHCRGVGVVGFTVGAEYRPACHQRLAARAGNRTAAARRRPTRVCGKNKVGSLGGALARRCPPQRQRAGPLVLPLLQVGGGWVGFRGAGARQSWGSSCLAGLQQRLHRQNKPLAVDSAWLLYPIRVHDVACAAPPPRAHPPFLGSCSSA